VREIKSKVYPRERGIHAFQAPSIVQEHRKKKNPRDKFFIGRPWKFFKSIIYAKLVE
jgi:hypothetical protein